MKIAVIGAGGVGGYFGARLQAAGEEVTFVQRGEHGAAMRRNGLAVASPLGDLALPHVAVVGPGEAASIGPVDLVLVAVKSIHTDAAADTAAAMLGPDTAVLSLQNGVENEDRLAARLGAGRVLGGLCYILALIDTPGRIRHGMRTARIEFGERDGRATARAEAFRAACANAGIDVILADDVAAAIWTKFTLLCAHNGMTALVEDPMVLFDSVPADMTSSTLYDLEHGKPLEIDWLNGAVARLGREAGVPTPVNRCIYAALKPRAAGAPRG